MNTLQSPVHIAIAGLGDVALQHKRAIDMCRDAKLTGVWTRNREKLNRLAKEWSVQSYPDYDTLLEDKNIHAVIISTADEVHYDFTMRALAAGKHVIIEKPPAENAARVEEMRSAALKAGLQCIPMHNYVYRPRMLQAKKLLDTGRLGTVTFGFFSEVMNMPEEWAEHYHGVLVTAMYHLIYASLFLMGKPDRIFAQQESIHYTECKDDDLTTVHLHYPNGAMVTLLGNWAADDLTTHSWFSMYKLIGTKGGTNITGHDALVYKKSGWGSLEWPDYEDSFIHSIDYIVSRCLLNGEPPLSGLDESITTMKITELAQQSTRENKAIEMAVS